MLCQHYFAELSFATWNFEYSPLVTHRGIKRIELMKNGGINVIQGKDL